MHVWQLGVMFDYWAFSLKLSWTWECYTRGYLVHAIKFSKPRTILYILYVSRSYRAASNPYSARQHENDCSWPFGFETCMRGRCPKCAIAMSGPHVELTTLLELATQIVRFTIHAPEQRTRNTNLFHA